MSNMNYKKICLYTCITRNYDKLIEISKKEKNVDYICYTNNKKIKSTTWDVHYLDDKKLNDLELSKKIKILGTNELKKYDCTIWIDGQINFNTSVSKFLLKFVDLEKYDLVGIKHSVRNTVKDEINACYESRKEKIEKLKKFELFLKKENYLDDKGLMECGVIFRNFNNKKTLKTMSTWFKIIKKYSFRDQLSFNYSAYKNDLNYNMLNINIWNNPYFKVIGHKNRNDILLSFRCYNNGDFSISNTKFINIKCEKNIIFKIPYNTDCIKIMSEIDKLVLFKSIKTNVETKINIVSSVLNGFNIIGEHSVIEIYGNFKKGQNLALIFDYEIIDDLKLKEIIDINNKNIISLNNRITEFAETIKLSNNHINNLQQIIDTQEKSIKELSDNNNSLNSEIVAYKSTKSYRIHKKLKNIKKFLIRNKK